MFRRSSSNEPSTVGSRLSRSFRKPAEDNINNSDTSPVFQVLLEKKGRARGAIGLLSGRPWAIRTFKLQKQTLRYYDRDDLRGEVNIAGAKALKLESKDADQKPFPFVIQCVTNNNEHVILNASCEDVRIHCIEIFSMAANHPNWVLPEGMTTTDAGANSVIVEEQQPMEDEEVNHTIWFYEVVNEGSLEEVMELFEKHRETIDIDFLSPEDGQTPLTSACYRNNLEMVRFLLEECHAHINRQNYYGITALMLAVNFNRSELVDYLINYPECDVDLEDQNGESAYCLAVDEDVKTLILSKSKRREEHLRRRREEEEAIRIKFDQPATVTARPEVAVPAASIADHLSTLSHPLEVVDSIPQPSSSTKKQMPVEMVAAIYQSTVDDTQSASDIKFENALVDSPPAEKNGTIVNSPPEDKSPTENLLAQKYPVSAPKSEVNSTQPENAVQNVPVERPPAAIGSPENAPHVENVPPENVVINDNTVSVNASITAPITPPQSKPAEPPTLVEGIPKHLYLAYLHYSVRSNEKKLNDAMKARNLPMAKQFSHQRDEAKRQLTDMLSSSSTISEVVSAEFLAISDVADQKQWLERQVQNYIDSLWSNEDLTEMDKFDAIEQATNFSDNLSGEGKTTTSNTESKTENKEELDTVWIQTSIMSLSPTSVSADGEDDEGTMLVENATFTPKDSLSSQRINVNVRLSLTQGLVKLENEYQLLSSLFAQSAKIVIKPIALLSASADTTSARPISTSIARSDGEDAANNSRFSPLAKGSIRSTVSDDESAALQSYIALVTAKHDGNLCSYLRSKASSAIRYGERLMIVESIVDIVLVAHNCGFCLLQDLNPLNLVKSNQSSDFVLGSLLHTVRFGQVLTNAEIDTSGRLNPLSAKYWSFELAKRTIGQDADQSPLQVKSSMDLCALGWIIWQVMGGVSLWEQRGIDVNQTESLSQVLHTLATITDEEIHQAITTAFPQDNKSSLRRLLSDLLTVDPNKRCNLSTVYDDYAFFGRSNVDVAEELANALERENFLRHAAELEAAEAQRQKNLYVQQVEALKSSLEEMLQALEMESEISSSSIQQLFTTLKATASVPSALVQLLNPVVNQIVKVGPTSQCNKLVLVRTLSSILKFHIDDIVQLPTTMQKVRSALKSRGNCLPSLLCMLPAINYSASATAAHHGRATGGSLMQQFKHLYWNRSKLVFICPVTLRLTQSGKSRQGYQLDPPEQWVIDSASWLKLGVLFLKLALLTQDFNQIPQHFQLSIDDLDGIIEMLNAVNTVAAANSSDFSSAILTLFELVGKEEGVDVHKLFSTWRLQRTGLTFTTCVKPRKTSSAWISEDGRINFEENGEEAFLV